MRSNAMKVREEEESATAGDFEGAASEHFSNDRLDFLTHGERQIVQRAIAEIRESGSALYIGKRLSELHSILAPYGYFLRAVAACRLVMRTAYGYKVAYENAVELLPAGAVQAMMDRGLTVTGNRKRMFGEWTETIAAHPAPQSGTPAVYARWVEELIERKPKRLTGHQANRVRKDPDELMDECLHVIERALKRLPAQRAVREKFARNLIRHTMRYFDLETEKFSPAEVA